MKKEGFLLLLLCLMYMMSLPKDFEYFFYIEIVFQLRFFLCYKNFINYTIISGVIRKFQFEFEHFIRKFSNFK